MGAVTCQVCGASLTGATPVPGKGPPPNLPVQPGPSGQTAASNGGQPAASPASSVAAPAGASVRSVLGWCAIDGRVILVEPLYMANADSHWGRLFLKLAIFGGLLYYGGRLLLLPLALLLLVMWLMSKSKFASNLGTQLIGFWLTRRLVGPLANVPVRDIRLRDAAGLEFLVRIKGQLVSGGVTVGDDLHVEGWSRGGTLLFRRGFNNRIRTAIKVKQ